MFDSSKVQLSCLINLINPIDSTILDCHDQRYNKVFPSRRWKKLSNFLECSLIIHPNIRIEPEGSKQF